MSRRRVQYRGLRRAPLLNPTQPLPPEYPSDKAFFTVTFFYNETPRLTPLVGPKTPRARSQQLGLLILLFAFIAYVIVRLR